VKYNIAFSEEKEPKRLFYAGPGDFGTLRHPRLTA
jgi:hypothetical protein